MVAIIPLIFSPGINDGESKSIRFSVGTAVFSLAVDRPGAPVGGESCNVGAALPPADAWEDGSEKPASTEFGVPPVLFLLLLLLSFWPLLGCSIMLV